MRRWIVCLLLAALCLALCVQGACAQRYLLTDRSNSYFDCEDFAGALPASVQSAFGGLMRGGDEVICGTVFVERYRNEPLLNQRGAAMAAVRREGRILLMGASHENGVWQAGVETDGFLPPDADFSITCLPMESEEYVTYVHLALICGDSSFLLRTLSNGGLYVYAYERRETDGSATRYQLSPGFYAYRKMEESLPLHSSRQQIPVRLAAWTLEAFPTTLDGFLRWFDAHPVTLAADEGYTAGVNLREQPTGQSKSWGEYSAKVKILGSQAGQQVPWYHVQVGNLSGWVSGAYLRTQEHELIGTSVTSILPVGRADGSVTLRQRPDGEAVCTVQAGMLMHVLAENDGWLHVILPRSALTWETDWDGTYGFVIAQEVTVGISRTDAFWR